MTITPKRQQQIAFTNRISNAPARLVARKPPLLPTADALKGKRVGVEQGSAQADYAVANWQPAGVQVVSYQNQDQVYADLVTGRLDAAFQASIAASDGFLKKPQGKFRVRRRRDRRREVLRAGRRRAAQAGQRPARAFNHALATILANGTYQRINKKYFDFDIYGAK